jgi:hypothetical protein
VSKNIYNAVCYKIRDNGVDNGVLWV